MRNLLLLLLLMLLLPACKRGAQLSAAPTEEVADTLPRATAIFWIDKHRTMKQIPEDKRSSCTFRTVKARVNIDSVGQIHVLSYVKPQYKNVQRYIAKRLEVFRVTKPMLESGYIHTGEQYVQLRYMPDKMWE